MSTQQLKNKVHRPQFPTRKPNNRDNVCQFITKEAKRESSYVILTTEADMFGVLIQWLDERKHNYVELKGGYRMRDGSDRLVVEDAVLVSQHVAVKIWKKGWLDKQESILHLYHRDILGRYKAELVFLNDIERDNIDLGLLVQTTKEKALSNPDGYSHKVESGSYWVII